MTRPTCVGMLLVLLVWVPTEAKSAPQSAASQSANKPSPATCPVTLPGSARSFGKRTPGREAMSLFEPGTSHWKPALILEPFGLWPEGTVVFRPGGPGEILPDGSLSMKFGWTRGEGLRGRL
jgi:hypothetical protein